MNVRGKNLTRKLQTLATTTLVASSVVMLDGCSKADDESIATSPNPTIQAQAVQSSIASAQPAPRGTKQDQGAVASSAPTASGLPSADSPPMNQQPTNVGAPMGAASMGMARMLGQAPMAGGAAPAGALPAAMGAPHIYHLGADTFFLDHANAVGLTPEQQKRLALLKENAATAFTTTQRKIDQGEQDLWALSSSETPDIAKIETKVGEITRLTGQQRVDFIRAVGVAVGVLSDAQRKAVAAQGAPMQPGAMAPAPSASGMNMGAAPSSSGMPMSAPTKMPKGMKMGGMGGLGDAGSSGGMGHM